MRRLRRSRRAPTSCRAPSTAGRSRRATRTPARDGEPHEAHDRPRRARASRARRPGAVSFAAAGIGESSIGLRAGQRVPVRDLVIGALVPSANDAATALAIAASGDVPRFVQAMNRKAEALGLTRTRYRNPHGLDEAGHVSTAADSAALLRAALRVPVIRRYVGMDRATLSDGRVVESTDNLLGTVPGFAGGRRGTRRSQAGRRSALPASRAWASPQRCSAPDRGAARSRPRRAAPLRPRELPVLAHRRREPNVRPGRRRLGAGAAGPRRAAHHRPSVADGESAVERVVAPLVATPPVRSGQRLGTVVVTDGSRVVARSPLVASRAEPSRRSRRRPAGWRGDPSTVSWGSSS